MTKGKSLNLMLWALVLFILSVAASCELTPPVPGAAKWNINGELRYRAHHQIKEVPCGQEEN